MDETVECTKCGKEIGFLEVFPGGLCLECYTPIGEAEMETMTPEKLAGMFRGTVGK